ncbi:RagB/SusD family nutrient uptake outer membrane protein [Robertkochia solimangrovi]|uniref:RagB/SusD family nutrient uptake outer membrane protein n=1 Tax=Robertkochia solimangrovi TaxID=2213046 RepID=UPI00117DA3B7|nr:RagB/SusD family nutrient uptake outer membrane protein [Robertkochia solimangrovi]TRZ45734.1 hypothetical protein DMZ48_00180 [Robertkochia solimangrovi]
MKKLLILLITTILITSCSTDEFLDVIPTGSKIPNTVEDFDKLLNDYNSSYPTWNNVSYMDPDTWMPGENYNYLWRLFWREQYKWSEQQYNVDDNDYDWIYKYQRIYVYNLIISYVDEAPLGGTMTEADRMRIKGEAHAQRAFDYFFLVNEYGPHYTAANLEVPTVPLVLETDLSAQPPKATVGEIYELIENDIAIAEELLKNGQVIDEDANFRPGSASVYAFRSWIALYKGDFETAKTYSDKALDLFDYLYDYTELENKTAGDPWSGLSITDFDYSTDNHSVIWNRYHRWTYYDPAQQFLPELAELFDQENDQRFILFASPTNYFGTFDASPNWYYARYYAESVAGIDTKDLLMVSAEAHIRTGDAQGALDRINYLLEHRILNFTPYEVGDFSGNEAILQFVKDERRKELMATGKNWFDLKRYHAYGETVPTYTREVEGQTYTLEPGSDKYIVPISPKILNLNPNL